ncbi:hypothetical protein LB523_17050 [Mesorhizobium sp. ESP-6-4]|uniref:hypothetical protein n=1 Tax=Mesorhizobium sp. ESP-6-4 TaxID=2876624 RepID=UPI001CCAF442|nr:hypothetical protein [Mesorhizobium sp. ESP-6-4]MBZ9660763.1 hypothetical protein [Mesorhizobium sp. ESP-6-4]
MHAHEAGQVARISCGHCHITRHYKPIELREVIGNVTINQLREKVRCQACGKREWMSAELFHPYGQELVSIRFRRLKEIRWERRVIWRDE